jgi:hypothetical protein
MVALPMCLLSALEPQPTLTLVTRLPSWTAFRLVGRRHSSAAQIRSYAKALPENLIPESGKLMPAEEQRRSLESVLQAAANWQQAELLQVE